MVLPSPDTYRHGGVSCLQAPPWVQGLSAVRPPPFFFPKNTLRVFFGKVWVGEGVLVIIVGFRGVFW